MVRLIINQSYWRIAIHSQWNKVSEVNAFTIIEFCKFAVPGLNNTQIFI